jgi:hypothetical protein
MKPNPAYQYQQRRMHYLKSNSVLDPYTAEEKKNRKKLAKKLRAQQQPGRHVHEIDDVMFENLCSMLDSVDDDNITLAKDILFKSKLLEKHITHLVHKYLDTMLYAPTTFVFGERLRIHSNGNVGIGVINPSSKLTI